MIHLIALPVVCFALASPSLKVDSYQSEEYSYKEENRYLENNKKLVSYDDEEYTITLSAYELNNYVWENFYNYLVAHNSALNEEGCVVYYNNISTQSGFSDDDVVNGNVLFTAGPIGSSDYYIYFNYTYDDVNNYAFAYVDTSDGAEFLPIEYDLQIVLTSLYYSDVKQAIELDIQANQSNAMPSISDIFQQVTAAITAFVGSLGTAFEDVTALFWDSTAATPGPTFLGMLVLILVGVGIVYGCYRVIKGLLHRV